MWIYYAWWIFLFFFTDYDQVADMNLVKGVFPGLFKVQCNLLKEILSEKKTFCENSNK